VQIVKSVTTVRETVRKKPTLKSELWTDGYYVVTDGERANWGTGEKQAQKKEHPKAALRQLQLFD
jgi:hypothetical protein